jgi:hypothetical protein
MKTALKIILWPLFLLAEPLLLGIIFLCEIALGIMGVVSHVLVCDHRWEKEGELYARCTKCNKRGVNVK